MLDTLVERGGAGDLLEDDFPDGAMRMRVKSVDECFLSRRSG